MTVYREFDRDTLEREYNIRGTVTDAYFDETVARYASESARMRGMLDCVEDVSYGPSADEVVDIFPAGDRAPVLFWVHGGYWRALSHKDSSFMAETFVKRGIALVAVNYSLAPSASLDVIVAQCRRAFTWLHENASTHGIDPDRIYVGGTSAGGHLAGMLVAGGWHAEYGVPEDAIKGCCALNGLHDLEPLLHCAPNTWLNLDSDAARRNSPIHHIPDRDGCPLIVSYGGNETAEFKRQTNDFAAAWRARGYAMGHVDMTEWNHFNIVFDLMNPKGRLTQAVLAMTGM